MPWKEGHKEATRERIVKAAASAFRKRGLAGVGVADVMEQAGLTHGGFYAHFKSKDELIAAALQEASGQSAVRRMARGEEGEAASHLQAIAARYLRLEHAQHPETGCVIAALGQELGRDDSPVRDEFDANLTSLRKLLATRAPGADAKAQAWQATGTLAAMVGGIVLARGLEDPAEAERLLSQVRRFVAEGLGEEVAPNAPKPA
ncbi:MAG TPA: TetR/AcrR family transcriptional regulator [bacterium]